MANGLGRLATAFAITRTNAPLPYAEVSETAWNSEAAARWTGTIDPTTANTLHAEGPCPRCSHDASADPVDEVVPLPETATIVEEVAAVGLKQYTFVCNCSAEHPDRPNERDTTGCGGYWNMVGLWRADATGATNVSFFGGSPATSQQRREAQELDKLDTSELDRVRAAADKWKTGLAGLLALIATVSVVKGRDSFKDLNLDRQHAIIVVVGIALALATIASLLAMRAAYGPLERQSLGAGGLRALRRQEAANALSDLSLARTLTVFSLIALAAAVGMTWWGEEGKAGKISVTRGDESIVCGTLVDADGTKVRVKVADQTQAIPLGDVKQVEFVQKC